MSSSSYFWANLGILQKIGVWSPFYATDNGQPATPNRCSHLVYTVYRSLVISFCAWHTFTECFLIAYDLPSLSMDELTVSIAYDIQHFLGLVKVYIIISQRKAIVALDKRTKMAPLYRGNDERFKKSLGDCVRLSDRIGYIYWFFVLITISCGGATGIFVTYKNQVAMQRVCAEKLEYYRDIYGDRLATLAVSPVAAEAVTSTMSYLGELLAEDNDPGTWPEHVAVIEEHLLFLNLTLSTGGQRCGRPKRVFPYHVWLPFDAKRSPYFQVYFVLNFLAGFSLVCCILPIDLMVMSYMRYIRFQFGVLRKDLLNLREDCIADVRRMRKGRDGRRRVAETAAAGFVDGNGSNSPDEDVSEEVLTQQIIRRLKQIIHHQLAIFDFFAKTNDLFTWVLFAQYLGSAIMICGVLYTISSVVGDMMTPKFFHVAFFYSGLIFQLYSNCFYGNDVLVLSGGIAEFAYFSGWQESGASAARLKPYIIMIMTQSLHPCKLTAGKFAGVDLPTFLAVFKASYTYYTVLVDDGVR